MAMLATLFLFVVTAFALMSAIGVATESRRTVMGGREAISASYHDAERELSEKRTRRMALKVERTAASIEAAIGVVFARPIKDGERVRGTVEKISDNCKRVDARTVDACEQIAVMRGELATAVEAARIDVRIDELQSQVGRLRDKGGAQETSPQASTLARLSFGFFTVRDIEFGLPLVFAIMIELVAEFGLFVTNRAWRAMDDTGRRMAPPAAKAAPAPRRESIGDVASFTATRLARARGGLLEVSEVYAGYVRWCAGQRAQPVGPAEFVAPFHRACEQNGIKMREKHQKIYCVNVALAA